MTEIEKRRRRYVLLIQQLDVIVVFSNDLKLPKKEKEEAIDRILDEIIEIRQFLNLNKK
jgi:hypothetical protein